MRYANKLPFQATVFGLATLAFSLVFSSKTDVQSGDARLSATLAHYQIEGFGKSLSLRSDFLFGIGGLQGGYLFWLDPVSVVGSIGRSIYNQVLVSLVAALIIFLLTSRLMRNCGQSLKVSRSAAILTSIATIWGYAIALVDSELFGHVPQYASLLIISLAILCCFTQPQKNNLCDLSFGTSFVVLVLYALLVLPHLFITALPLLCAIATSFLIYLFATKNFKDLKRRLILLGSTIIILLWLGVIDFLYGFYKNTAASEFPLGTYNQPRLNPPYRFIFETFFPTPSASGNYFFQFLCFGFLIIFLAAGFDKKNRDQLWVASILAAVFLLCYRLWQSTWDVESGPRINYFVWMLSPLYAIAVIRSFFSVFAILKKVNFMTRFTVSRLSEIAIVLVIFVGFCLSPLTSLRFSLNEPESIEIETIRAETSLVSNLALSDGSVFRGRAAFLLQQPQYPENVVGRVPLLNDYSHNLTPALFSFFEEFLLDQDSDQFRNRFVFGVQNLKLYQMLGVRYLIVPSNYPKQFEPSEAIVKAFQSEVDPQNKILEINGVNVGQYSPTVVKTAETLSQVFDVMGQGDFDPMQDVVLNDGFKGQLISATSSILEIEQGDLRVRAKSDGISLLLLPLEFSSCLSVESLNSSTGFLEIRAANSVLAAIIFDQEIDARIKLRFGLLKNSNCRRLDFDNFVGFNS